MNTSSQTMRVQGSPILLLAQLLADNPELPAATYQIDSIVPGELHISLHRGNLQRFEEWRRALDLSAPVSKEFGASTWVEAAGVVQDVPVQLIGHAAPAEVAALVSSAVAA